MSTHRVLLIDVIKTTTDPETFKTKFNFGSSRAQMRAEIKQNEQALSEYVDLLEKYYSSSTPEGNRENLVSQMFGISERLPSELKVVADRYSSLAEAANKADAQLKKTGATGSTLSTQFRTFRSSIAEYGNQTLIATVRTKALGIAMKGIVVIGNMLIDAAISIVVNKFLSAIDENIIHKAEYAAQAAEDIRSKFSSIDSDTSQNISTLSELQER